jgi:hypothetical protein
MDSLPRSELLEKLVAPADTPDPRREESHAR